MTKKRSGRKMSPTTLHPPTTQKHKDTEKKRAALRSGGSLKTVNKIDAQEICREARGK